MALHHYRKLLCDSKKCPEKLPLCLCNDSSYIYPPPSRSPPFFDEGLKNNDTKTSSNKTSTYLILTFALVATAFFLLCSYAIYAKFFSSRNRSRTRLLSSQQPQQADAFDDQEHGPVVDHPIWYIRTTGLQPSVIGAITVCKYKRGEGLIEGTDCSVCLSEFQEDENLRLLPKCNHAFHLPCIDTWLRSHTNCPLCRAPIVTDPTLIFTPSVEVSAIGASSSLDAQGEGGMENSDEVGEEVEEASQSVASEVVNSNVQPRRSVSLDSSSAANISLALARVVSAESRGNSKRITGNGKGGSFSSSSRTRYLHSEPSSMKRSRSFNAKHLISWNSRSQRKPNPPLRSF